MIVLPSINSYLNNRPIFVWRHSFKGCGKYGSTPLLFTHIYSPKPNPMFKLYLSLIIAIFFACTSFILLIVIVCMFFGFTPIQLTQTGQRVLLEMMFCLAIYVCTMYSLRVRNCIKWLAAEYNFKRATKALPINTMDRAQIHYIDETDETVDYSDNNSR